MSKISRRGILAAAGTALAADKLGFPMIRSARAAEFTLKFASDIPVTHPLNVRMKEATEEILKATDGRVQIGMYPNNQLGGDPDMFSQLRAGALDFFTLSGANVLSGLVPKAAISGVGFAFKDARQVHEAMDGDLGAFVRRQIEHAGIDVLDKIWENGFRQITTSTKPVRGPADLVGMKIRVPPGQLWVSLFKALKAAPATISWNEAYTALQTKIVDAQENALTTIYVAKVYEVQKYCSMTNHMWDGFWFLMNRNSWKKLPSAMQEIVAKYVNGAALKERQDVIDQDASLQKTLEQKGLVFNTTNPQEFRDELKKSGFYGEWRKSFGDQEWSLLEKVTGPLA